MSSSQSAQAYLGLLLILGMGIGLFALHITHVFGENENIYSFTFGILIPMALSVGLLIGGVWLWQQTTDGEYIYQVAVWAGTGAIVVAITSIFSILYQESEGVTMTDQLFVVANGASGGALVGFFLGIYNIRLKLARQEAKRLGEQLTVLNRVLRHDIRNKANLISGNAAILSEAEKGIREKAQTIQQQATDLVALGDEAREIEQLFHEEGFEPDVINLTSLIKNQSEEFENKYPAVEFSISLPEEELVRAHPLIDSAVRNVIENAVEHNDKDTPQVTIESEHVTGPGGDAVELRVADNGPGFNEGEIRALERGYETDLEHTNGLGLWLVNWVVEKSGGTVRFEDPESGGSVICLELERPGRAEASIADTVSAVT